MSELIQYLKSYTQHFVDDWNRFWFQPTDPITLGIIRILTGAMLFYTHWVWLLDFEAFFGPNAWISAEAWYVGKGGDDAGFVWTHFNWISSLTVLYAVHWIALAVFALLTLGLWTRPVAILSFLFAVSYANRQPGALFGLDQLNTMLAMYLAVGASGAALSVDRLRQKKRISPSELPIQYSVSANIAIRLMQIHLCIIYLFSGLGKLMGPVWWDGTAIWGAVANLEYQSVDATWLVNWPLVVNLMTHVTIAWEVFYIALIWPKRTRPIMLLIAIPLHAGIAIFLGMITFGTIMLIANMAFIPPEFFRWLAQAWRNEGTSTMPNSIPPAIAKRQKR